MNGTNNFSKHLFALGRPGTGGSTVCLTGVLITGLYVQKLILYEKE